MAVISVPKRSAVSLKLNAGTNPDTGNDIVRSCALGSILPGADGEAIMNVADLLAPVLAHPVLRVEHTVVRTLER